MARVKQKTEKAGRNDLTLEPHQVIIKPMLTEKGIFQSENFNQYTFRINPLATKTDVRNAIEKLFEVSAVSYTHLTLPTKA